MDTDFLLELDDVVANMPIPRPRLRDSLNPLEWYFEDEFFKHFHLSKNTTLYIIEMTDDALKRPTRRSNALNTIHQVCVTLLFYTTGSYQRVVGEVAALSMSRSAVCRSVKAVTNIIAGWRPFFVCLPNRREQRTVSEAFAEKCRFPGVLGAIDCTHVRVQKPPGNANAFLNRKGFYSLNCQFVCDTTMKFQNVVCRWVSSQKTFVFPISSFYHKTTAEQVYCT